MLGIGRANAQPRHHVLARNAVAPCGGAKQASQAVGAERLGDTASESGIGTTILPPRASGEALAAPAAANGSPRGGRPQAAADGAGSGAPRVFHNDQATPAARMPKVIPSDRAGGNFSSPSRSARKILEPMKISTAASACLR